MHHSGLWAAVRGPREPRSHVLETCLVELDRVFKKQKRVLKPSSVFKKTSFAGCLPALLATSRSPGYSEDQRCYRALAGQQGRQQVLWIDRLCISRVIQVEDPGAAQPSSWKMGHGGSSTAPSLAFILDRAFEFQLLLKHVREELTDRLTRMPYVKKGEAYTGIYRFDNYTTILEKEYMPLRTGDVPVADLLAANLRQTNKRRNRCSATAADAGRSSLRQVPRLLQCC